MAYHRRSVEEKRACLEAWRQSGMSATRYAKSVGMGASTIHHWLALDAAGVLEEQEARVGPVRELTLQRFHDVEVVDELFARPAPFTLTLAGAGHRIDVPQGFDAAELRRLVAALC